VDLTRLAGQFGNLAGNLLFRGRPEIDEGYKQLERAQYEQESEIGDLFGRERLDLDGMIIEGLFSKAKKKKEDYILPKLEREKNPYEADSCAECRARQAKSGMMNIMDPCRDVCGG
jgi:hypothetical protein